jgi:hypothetical protein
LKSFIKKDKETSSEQIKYFKLKDAKINYTQKIMVHAIFELIQIMGMIYTKGNQHINFDHVVEDHEPIE